MITPSALRAAIVDAEMALWEGRTNAAVTILESFEAITDYDTAYFEPNNIDDIKSEINMAILFATLDMIWDAMHSLRKLHACLKRVYLTSRVRAMLCILKRMTSHDTALMGQLNVLPGLALDVISRHIQSEL